MSDAYQLINVIRQAVSQETQNGASVEYSYGQISTASGYQCSAYLNGNYDTTSDDFRVPSHLHVNSGDYGMFAVNHATGGKWLVEVLPNSLYSKLSIDTNNGVLYVGDGTDEGTPVVPGGGGSGSRRFAFFMG